jgi:hypothetical protein
VQLDVDISNELVPYYVAVVIDGWGYLYIQTQTMGTATPVEVVADNDSVKLADILVNAQSGIVTANITDTRFIIVG